MRRFLWLSCLLALLVSTAPVEVTAENWPSWRGPHSDGVSREQNVPFLWRRDLNLAWQAPLPGFGAGSPVVWEDAVFVTAQEGDALLLLRFDRKDGRLVWRREIGVGTAAREADRGEQKFHRLHNLASPSPVTDGEVVVAHFGNGLLAAFDLEGEELWRRDLQADHGAYTVWWGHSNSPVIHGDLVISVCMQDPLSDLRQTPAPSYLVAHERRTGRVVWTRTRMTGAEAEQGDAYTTPVFRQIGGQTEMIVMGGNQLSAYDPTTGEQRWFLPGLIGGRTVTGPVYAGGFVFTTIGMKGDLLAVDVGSRVAPHGELPRRAIRWRYPDGTPDSCTPVVWADLLFCVSDNGVARAIDARSGALRWKERLPGSYKASPVAAESRIYFLNTTGLCTVMAASPRPDKLAENQLGDQTLASPAISQGNIFLRAGDVLYCVGHNR